MNPIILKTPLSKNHNKIPPNTTKKINTGLNILSPLMLKQDFHCDRSTKFHQILQG